MKAAQSVKMCMTCGSEDDLIKCNSWGLDYYECLKCRRFLKMKLISQTHPSTNLTKRIIVCKDCPYEFHPCPKGCSKRMINDINELLNE